MGAKLNAKLSKIATLGEAELARLSGTVYIRPP